MIAVRELPHDPVLPQIGTALDPVMMCAYLQESLFAADGDAARYALKSCEITHVKYKAGKKCVIGYVVAISDRNDARHITYEQRFSARLYPPGTSFARYRKAQNQPLATPAYGQPLVYLPTLDMLLWRFPNDRKITGVPALMAAATRQNDVLAEIVRDHLGTKWRIVEATSRVIHHVPEKSCMVRVMLELTQPGARQSRHETFFGKTYYNDDGAETWRLMQALWASNAHRQQQLRMARPLAYDPHERILWQGELTGCTLITVDMTSPHFADLLTDVARSVAVLHTAKLPCARTTTREAWLTQLDAMRSMVTMVQPDVQGQLHRLLDRLLDAVDYLEAEPQATLHGDLHLQNFFVDEDQAQGQRVALIDLDNLSTGAPCLDLGSFFACLYYRALLTDMPITAVDEMIDTFCHTYAQHVPWRLSARTIRWHTAVALLNERVFRAFTRVKAGRMALVDELIQVAKGVYTDD